MIAAGATVTLAVQVLTKPALSVTVNTTGFEPTLEQLKLETLMARD